MDKTEIRAIVAAEKRAAIGSSTSSDLAKQRSDALDYYLGDLKEHMPTLEGQSSAKSTDVSDTIEMMLPALMDIFTSGDDYCEFTPQGPEDEEAAQQETDYVNHVFMNENPGFLILYSQIKDALLSKNGIVKAWWEETKYSEKETYRGLDEGGFAAIAAQAEAGEVEIIQLSVNEVEGEPFSADVVCRQITQKGCFKAAAVPPEEFGISARTTNIPKSPYCYHKYQRSQSELIEEGYDKATVEALPTSFSRLGDGDEETRSRDTFADESDPSSDINKSMRMIDVTEHYIRLDVDGDGVAELLKVVTAGSAETLLGDPEEVDRMPFHSITPYPMPHRFFGRSVADLTIDIMRIKTHLLRQLLDNASLLNNQRIAVGSQGADENTLDDLLTNRPGGIVRMKDVDQLKEIPNQPLGAYVLPLLEYTDQTRETRTGVTRTTGGIDPDVLNKAAATATGFQGLLDQSMMRIKLIARIFAETGIKDLFLHIHELLRKHQDKSKVIRLRNKWVPVDPREWQARSDMTVSVALGSGSKQQQLMLLNSILERQIQALELQGGANGPLVTLTNVYNTIKRMIELAGQKNVDAFITEPDPEGDYEMPNPEESAAQAKLRLEQQRMEMDAAKQQQDIDLKREEAAAKIVLMREESAAKIELEREKSAAELQQSRERMFAEIELERERMALEAEQNERNAARQHEVAMEGARIKENRPGGSLAE